MSDRIFDADAFDPQGLIALLSEVETAIGQVNVPLDQHSRAAKARAFAALKEAQREAEAWAQRLERA